jgi:hypothetical protein
VWFVGSLPLIKDLQDAGFDVQIVGFGRMSAYHAVDEYGMIHSLSSPPSRLCSPVFSFSVAFLSDFVQGHQIIAQVVETLSSANK